MKDQKCISLLLLSVLQLSVLTGVRYLQTSLENLLRQGDPNSESEGWLLENSFVETARSNFNIIKSLGKSNQIHTAVNGDPNMDVPSTAHYGPDNLPPNRHTWRVDHGAETSSQSPLV